MKKNYNTNNPKATKTHLIHQVKHDTRNYQDSNSVITSATAIRLQRKLKRQEADKRREVSFAAEQESGWTEVLTMVEQQQINDARNKLRTTMHLNVKSSLLLSFLILFTNIVSVAGAQAGVTPRAIDNKKGDEIDPVTDVQASGTRVMNGPTIEVGLFADQVGNTKVNNIAGLKIKRDTSVPVVSAQRSAEVAPVNNPREKRAINPVKNQNCVNSGEILKYLVKILTNPDVREEVFSIQKRSLASNTILGLRLGTRINIRVDNPILQRSRLSIYNSDASHSPCVVGNAQFNSSEIKRRQGSFVDAILNDDGLTAASRAGTGPIMVSTWRTHYSENYMHLLPLSQAEISSQNNLVIKKDGSVSSILHDHASYFMSIFHHVCANKTIDNIGLLYDRLPSNGTLSGATGRAIYGYCSNRSSDLANILAHGAIYNDNGGFVFYEANQTYKGHDVISKLVTGDIELDFTRRKEDLSVRFYDNSVLPINAKILLGYSGGRWVGYGELNNYMKDWRYQSGLASRARAHYELYSNTSVIDLCDLQAVHASESLFTAFDCPRPTLAPIATTSTSLPPVKNQNCVNSGEILKYLIKILTNPGVREEVFSIQKLSLTSNAVLRFRLDSRMNRGTEQNPVLQRSRLGIYNSDASHSPCVVGNAQFNSSEIKRWQGSFVDASLHDDSLTTVSRAGTGPIMVSTWRAHYSADYMHLLPLSQAEISSQNNLVIKKDGSVSSILHDHASYFMNIFHNVCANKTIDNIGLLYNELPSKGAVSGVKGRAIYGYCSNRSSDLANIFVHGANHDENGGFLLYEANQTYKGHDIISKLDLSDIELNLTGWRENLSVRLYDNSSLSINTEILLAYSGGQWLRYGEMNNYMKDWRYQSGILSRVRAHHELYSNTIVIDLCDLQAVRVSERLFTAFDCFRPKLKPIAKPSTSLPPVKDQNCVNSGEILKYLVKILTNPGVREEVFSIQKRSLASNTILGFRLGTRMNIRMDNSILQRSRLGVYNSYANHSPCIASNAQFNSPEIKRWQGSFVDASLHDDSLITVSRAGTGPIMVSTWRAHYSADYIHLLPLSQAQISSKNNLVIKKGGSPVQELFDYVSYFMVDLHNGCANKTIDNIGLLHGRLPSNGTLSGVTGRGIYGYCSNESNDLVTIVAHGATYEENGIIKIYEGKIEYQGLNIVSKLVTGDIELKLSRLESKLYVRFYYNSNWSANENIFEITNVYSAGDWLQRIGGIGNYIKDWRYQSGFASLKRTHRELYSNTTVIDLCNLQAVHASEQLFIAFDCLRPMLSSIATTHTHYTSTSLPAIAMQNTTALLTNETVTPDLSTESDINASLPAIAIQNTTALLTNETVTPDLSTESDINASLPVIAIQNTTISIAVACVLIGGLITAVCLIKRSYAKRNDNINDLAFVQVELSPLQAAEPVSNTANLNADDSDRLQVVQVEMSPLQAAEPVSNTANLNADDADRLQGLFITTLVSGTAAAQVAQSNNAVVNL